MTEETSEAIQFEYGHIESGFANLSITVGDETRRLSPGYLHDTLGDIIRAAIFLCGGGMSAVVQMNEEIGPETQLLLSWWGDVEVKIGDETVFQNRATLESLLRAIEKMADTVFENYDAQAYRDNWGMHDLPVEELKLLKKLLEHRVF